MPLKTRTNDNRSIKIWVKKQHSTIFLFAKDLMLKASDTYHINYIRIAETD